MNNSELNHKFHNIPLNLEILAEECAEVIQIKSKIIRFGILDYHPIIKVTNQEMLTNELGDVLAMIDILIANNVLNKRDLDSAKKAKINKLPKYYIVEK